MLVASDRHTDADLAAWARLERYDQILGTSPALSRKVMAAQATIAAFVAVGPCYLGVSWGKDSVTVAGLVAEMGLRIPHVWTRSEPKTNPDCALVRDAFLLRYPATDYHEIVSHCTRDTNGNWEVAGAAERGFAEAGRRFGDRYVSGIRSEESQVRRLREALHGTTTARTCAPITRWTGADVFAYLYTAGLPVHPAYACSYGGALERDRIRVAPVGGEKGLGRGRREWEWTYYREALAKIDETVVATGRRL